MTDKIKAALRELVNSEDRAGMEGAIGRHGTLLVKQGLAVRLGRQPTDERYHNGQRNSVYVRFEFTPEGRAAADALGYESSQSELKRLAKQRGYAFCDRR